MRTTINIDDDLHRAAKLHAAQTHRTLTAVIEDALRLAFATQPGTVSRRRASVPVCGEGGLQPGADLNENAALLDRMEKRLGRVTRLKA